jgi:hypothetical protein
MSQKQDDLLFAEVIIKVAAIERLLIKAGIFTSDTLSNEMKTISEEVMSFVKKNLDPIVIDKEKN